MEPCSAGPAGLARRRRLTAILAVAATLTLTVLASVLGTWFGARAAHAASGERITDYAVRLDVHADGSLRVTETIDYDFGTNRRHGIVRVIPVRSRHDRRHDRLYPITGATATATGGASAQVRTTRVGADEHLTIGDHSATVTGQHTYTIGYTVRGAMDATGTGPELVWDAVGTRWAVPIERATVVVTGPAGLVRQSCASGPAGRPRPCASANQDGPTASFGQGSLASGDGMTIRAVFPSGSVAGLGPLLAGRHTFTGAFGVTPATVGGAVGVAGALALGALIMAYFTSGAAGAGGSTKPPFRDGRKWLAPAEAGAVWAGRLRGRHVAATIADLAARGYVEITEVPVDPPAGAGQREQRRRHGQRGQRGQRRDWVVSPIPDPLPRLRRSHEAALLDAFFPKDRRSVRLSDVDTLVGESIHAYWRALRDDLSTRSRRRYRIDAAHVASTALGFLLVVAALVATLVLALSTWAGLVGFGLVAGSVVVAAVLYRWSRPGDRAIRTRGEVVRLRRYLLAASRAGDLDSVARYLPYAMALDALPWRAPGFDVGGLGQFSPPSWYEGSDEAACTAYQESLDDFASAAWLPSAFRPAVLYPNARRRYGSGHDSSTSGLSGTRWDGSSGGWGGGAGVGIGDGGGGGGGGSW